MARISIIGTGNMGQAIAGVFAKGGHTVQLLGQGDAATAIDGDIVVLAVPYSAVTSIVQERGESLAGKIVVDITNPVNFETFDSLVVPADGSATAEIAKALPQSRLVKAFNTTFAARSRRAPSARTPRPCSSRATTPTRSPCWPGSSPPVA